MPTTTATGGKPKSKKTKTKTKAKKPAKKVAAKKPAKKTGPSLEQLKKKARSLGIPLSKDGKAKTKTQLKASIAYKTKK